MLNSSVSVLGVQAHALSQIGQIDQAFELISKIMINNPYVPSLIHHQAKLFKMKNELNISLKLAEICSELAPESISNWLLLSELYYMTKNYAKALLIRH